VNYLRACPLPEAAAAVRQLEKIDPEAVRRAATLAGLAGIAAAAPAGDDATKAAAEGDASLAGQIGAVIADEDPADGEPGRDPATPPATIEPSPAPAAAPAGDGWKWALWGVVVLVVAVVTRTLLRPGSAGAG